MVDIIIGAIAADSNQRVRKPCKKDLAKYVLAKANRLDWTQETPPDERCFTVWHFKKKPTPPDLGF
jgi:hypothetical protein